jgi:uncharacterized OB-fold protein
VDESARSPVRLLPETGGPTAPFWAGARANRLHLPFCAACDRPRWPLRELCSACHTDPVRWRDLRPAGTLVSHSRVHRHFHPGVPASPYWLAVVAVVPGLRMLGNLVPGRDGRPPAAPSIGIPVVARFDRIDDRVTLVNWQLEDQA